MMFCWIVISLLVRLLKAQDNHIVIYAQKGGTATLPIDLSLDPNNLYVNWYRGSDENPTISRNPQSVNPKGKEVTTHASLLPDYSLQISSVQDSDFQVWRCVQHVLTNSFTKTYKLHRVTIPKVPAVMFGDSLSLECKLERSSAKTTVTWISPQNSDCNQIRLNGKTISVKDVSRCHSGVWTCLVLYDGKKAQATTTVYVIDLSPSPPDPIYTSVSLASTINIPCSLSSNLPLSMLNDTGLRGNWSFSPLSDQTQQQVLLRLSIGPVVTWDVVPSKDSKVQGRELKDQDLSILNLPVEEKIRGEYNCILKAKSKTRSSKVKVEVLQVLSSGGSRVLIEGEGVNLTCTLGHDPIADDLKVNWKCRSCSNLPSRSSPFLSIPEVRMEHSGQWTCELWKNETKLTYAVLSLKIEKAPVDIWLYVAIISGAVVFILLLVVAIIGIRRHKQMMMYRRRKTRFCCCKNPQPKGFYKT